MWLVLALCSALFAGLTSVLAKIGIRNTDSTLVTALRTIVVVIFSWLMVFVAGSQGKIAALSYQSILFLVLSGLATGASWLCYFKALQLGDVNKIAPIDKSSTILAMVLAFLILGEPITKIGLFGLFAIGIGTALMIVPKQKEASLKSERGWLFFAAGSAVFAALTSILGKIGIENVESNLGTAIRTCVVLIMAWVMVLFMGKQGEMKNIDRKSGLFIFLSGLTTGASWLCYYSALQTGLASVVVPIDKLSIWVTVIFSYFVLDEKIEKRAVLGLIVLTCGTLVLIMKR